MYVNFGKDVAGGGRLACCTHVPTCRPLNKQGCCSPCSKGGNKFPFHTSNSAPEGTQLSARENSQIELFKDITVVRTSVDCVGCAFFHTVRKNLPLKIQSLLDIIIELLSCDSFRGHSGHEAALFVIPLSEYSCSQQLNSTCAVLLRVKGR